MKFGRYELDLHNQVYIMGILNVTPDSFSDGGKYNQLDQALFHTEQMIQEGAAIIDVGGESTRPGYTQISEEEEIQRVVPVVEALHQRFAVPISVDTYKAGVAKAAIMAGTEMINDIYGGLYDNHQMAAVMGQAPKDTAFCLMHNRMKPVYENYLDDVLSDLRLSIHTVLDAGVEEGQIVIDPGIGFAKSYEQNLILMNHLQILETLGFPILLGTSRKSMIGLTLDLPASQRVEGTIATTVMGIMKGASIVRVHDVQSNYRAALMTKAILESESNESQHY